MTNRLTFYVQQLRTRLWIKPAVYCAVTVAAVLLAHVADYRGYGRALPEITPDTIQTLLTIITSSMLAVATFAVGSMVSAYGSASNSATPRAFALVLADDVSQAALSTFIGAFIFGIVATVALKTGYYGRGGLFMLFVLTLAIFAWVILTFVRWVDNIARLGRMGSTISKAEDATLGSLTARRQNPYLGGVEKTAQNTLSGTAVFCDRVGYIQHVDMKALQGVAQAHDMRIMLEALPGTFLAPGRPVAILSREAKVDDEMQKAITKAFVIGAHRTFEGDPRFGLIVLSEIAGRALSPAVNDPGTAIVVIGCFVRLLAGWSRSKAEAGDTVEHDRVIVPDLALSEMFDDAFTAIARDGAATVEVGIRLQKAFLSLAALDDPGMKEQAQRHSKRAFAQAEKALVLPDDLSRLRQLAQLLA